jgi:hypothetical protein
MIHRGSLLLVLCLLLCACRNDEFKVVKQQEIGEYTLSILTPTGSIKNGANDVILEFRKTSDKQLVDVSPVEISPVMEMPGMAPMMGTTTITTTDTPGRYRATAALTMAGLWKFTVKFGAGQSVRINLNAE